MASIEIEECPLFPIFHEASCEMPNQEQQHEFNLNELKVVQAAEKARHRSFLNTSTLHCDLFLLTSGSKDQPRQHTEEIVFFVESGKGKLRIRDKIRNCISGAILFVSAQEVHYFYDIEEDLTILTFFSKARPKTFDSVAKYEQGQVRARELDDIYEKAKESVQPIRELAIGDNNIQQWAQSLAPEPSDRSTEEQTAAQAAEFLVAIDNAPESDRNDSNDSNDAQTGDRIGKSSEVVIEDILARMNSDDACDSVIIDDVPPLSGMHVETNINGVDDRGSDDPDSTIQKYMHQLFGRVHTGSDSDPESVSVQITEMQSEQPDSSNQEPKFANKETVIIQTAPLSDEEYVPLHNAPLTNMDALRQLANETTRRAVLISTKRRTRSVWKNLYLIIATVAFGGWALIVSRTSLGFNALSLVSLGAFAAGCFCLSKFLQSKNDKNN